jgi:hypothetical protein
MGSPLALPRIAGGYDTVQTLFEPGHWRPTVILITHHVEELPPATSQVLLQHSHSRRRQGRLQFLSRPTLPRKNPPFPPSPWSSPQTKSNGL